jgi:hypothetical protein
MKGIKNWNQRKVEGGGLKDTGKTNELINKLKNKK